MRTWAFCSCCAELSVWEPYMVSSSLFPGDIVHRIVPVLRWRAYVHTNQSWYLHSRWAVRVRRVRHGDSSHWRYARSSYDHPVGNRVQTVWSCCISIQRDVVHLRDVVRCFRTKSVREACSPEKRPEALRGVA